MHEASAVDGAIEKVISGWPANGTGGQLELEIRDATRITAETVARHATACLRRNGHASASFTVTIDNVHCAVCGDLPMTASPAEPWCDHCGAPLPHVPGPAVVCREVAPCA